ncbi:uncharacterized protein DDB_G0290685-like [Denticeps clupeoides]|uniref:uncharacterized protein DDB_G0290685-like n=1 Tax=Denticeps clupeoides TaxID=299321 RepID=UPI0010A3647B|nr:uncharacterized protein DDB_G0290685-like [Denticeps clupeoides]
MTRARSGAVLLFTIVMRAFDPLLSLQALPRDASGVAHGERGGNITLNPKTMGEIHDIVWKHNGVKVLEYDQSQTIVSEPFKKRAILNFHSGELTIRQLSSGDDGVYESQINGKAQSMHNIKVLEAVTQPTVTCELTDDAHFALRCSIGNDAPAEYQWTGPKIHSQPGSELQISKDENPESVFTCDVRNAVSAKSAQFTPKDCRQGGVSPGILALVVLFLLAATCILVVISVLLYKRRRRKESLNRSEVGNIEKGENKKLLFEKPPENEFDPANQSTEYEKTPRAENEGRTRMNPGRLFHDCLNWKGWSDRQKRSTDESTLFSTRATLPSNARLHVPMNEKDRGTNPSQVVEAEEDGHLDGEHHTAEEELLQTRSRGVEHASHDHAEEEITPREHKEILVTPVPSKGHEVEEETGIRSGPDDLGENQEKDVEHVHGREIGERHVGAGQERGDILVKNEERSLEGNAEEMKTDGVQVRMNKEEDTGCSETGVQDNGAQEAGQQTEAKTDVTENDPEKEGSPEEAAKTCKVTVASRDTSELQAPMTDVPEVPVNKKDLSETDPEQLVGVESKDNEQQQRDGPEDITGPSQSPTETLKENSEEENSDGVDLDEDFKEKEEDGSTLVEERIKCVPLQEDKGGQSFAHCQENVNEGAIVMPKVCEDHKSNVIREDTPTLKCTDALELVSHKDTGPEELEQTETEERQDVDTCRHPSSPQTSPGEEEGWNEDETLQEETAVGEHLGGKEMSDLQNPETDTLQERNAQMDPGDNVEEKEESEGIVTGMNLETSEASQKEENGDTEKFAEFKNNLKPTEENKDSKEENGKEVQSSDGNEKHLKGQNDHDNGSADTQGGHEEHLEKECEQEDLVQMAELSQGQTVEAGESSEVMKDQKTECNLGVKCKANTDKSADENAEKEEQDGADNQLESQKEKQVTDNRDLKEELKQMINAEDHLEEKQECNEEQEGKGEVEQKEMHDNDTEKEGGLPEYQRTENINVNQPDEDHKEDFGLGEPHFFFPVSREKGQ